MRDDRRPTFGAVGREAYPGLPTALANVVRLVEEMVSAARWYMTDLGVAIAFVLAWATLYSLGTR